MFFCGVEVPHRCSSLIDEAHESVELTKNYSSVSLLTNGYISNRTSFTFYFVLVYLNKTFCLRFF